jgi:tetratricopeptide (TPR) repeat protein
VLENSSTVVVALVGALLVGGLAAGAYEWVSSRSEAAFDDVARVQTALEKALMREASAAGAANPDLAKKAREEAVKAREDAVTGFDAVMKERSGTLAGTVAGLSAARLEIEQDKLDAAGQRLEKLAESADGDISRAAVLRLRGYVLEETGHADQAADLYAQIGAIEEYPGRIQAYVQAAETYERIGKIAPAVQALEALTLVAPEYAEQADILPQLETLRARLGRETEGKPAESKPAE